MDDDRQTLPYLPGLDSAAKTRRIHPSVTAYISDHPKDLFGDVDLYAGLFPRDWKNASQDNSEPKCCDSPACKGRKYSNDEVVCFLCGNKLRVIC
jgi:hypothetical protein